VPVRRLVNTAVELPAGPLHGQPESHRRQSGRVTARISDPGLWGAADNRLLKQSCKQIEASVRLSPWANFNAFFTSTFQVATKVDNT
jgi:hypothetical protein